MKRLGLFAAAALTCAIAVGGGYALSQGKMVASSPAREVETPTDLLTEAIPDSTPNAGQVRRGQYLVRVGDCVSCHTRQDGPPLAGGYPLHTPFGTIFSGNLTSDARMGVGGWTGDQFYRAIAHGVGAQGQQLYPALPYTYFTRVSRADSDAILAYLKTTPAVDYTPPANQLPFPLNIRFMIRGWNLLFFHPGGFQPDPAKSAAWNRGAYIVTGFGHCGACHTPKNVLAGDKTTQALQGGDLENWVAPDLTGNPRTGLGRWNAADVVEYLKTGRNAHANAAGAMAEVVSYSTSMMSDDDLKAVATYLKDLPPSPDREVQAPDAGAMQRGAAIYSDACASCHLETGVGQPRFFPPMQNDAMAQQTNPDGLTHLILAGGRTAPTPTRLSPLSMPSFAWKLDDGQVADVATYVRNSWGNRAPAVTSGQVKTMRDHLGLSGAPHLTDNSGDHG